MNSPAPLSVLRELTSGAADLYLSSGNKVAVEAAKLMKSPLRGKVAYPPRELDVLDHLQSIALPSLEQTFCRLVQHFAPRLPWTNDGFVLPDAIRGRNAYAELIGPAGPLVSDECRFGFYLQAPHCLYPAHSHAAEELYFILSGSVEWRLGEAGPFVPLVPALIHHFPWQIHEMRTRHGPLLAMWVWMGDINYSTYSIG